MPAETTGQSSACPFFAERLCDGKVLPATSFYKRSHSGKGYGPGRVRLGVSVCKPGAGAGAIRCRYRHKGNASGRLPGRGFPASVAGRGMLAARTCPGLCKPHKGGENALSPRPLSPRFRSVSAFPGRGLPGSLRAVFPRYGIRGRYLSGYSINRGGLPGARHSGGGGGRFPCAYARGRVSAYMRMGARMGLSAGIFRGW